NFAVTDQSTSIDFPADGLWYELFSGDSVMVENGAALAMDFAPGDFMLYANRNIELTTSVNELTGVAVTVFPNPSQGTIHITSNSDVDIYRVALFDMTGRMLLAEDFRQNELDITHLPKGLYLLQVATSEGTAVRKIVRQ
ncbi:MAG: T9SS type A sorting domain-containing protein, partial [Bacteroidota bacterium]